MLSSYKEKELVRLDNALSSYNLDIAELTEQMNTIDEKYRRMAEEEKKDLNEALEYCREQRDSVMARREFLVAGVAPVAKEEVKEEPVAEEEPKVVDSLFPENNVEESVAEETFEESVEETSAETPVEEPQPEEPAPIEPEEKKEETIEDWLSGGALPVGESADPEGWDDVPKEW